MERTDAELISEYIEGQRSSLEILINRHIKTVYNFAYRMTGNTADADDVTQESFLKAWKNIKKYNPDFSFKTWILSIARNTAIDFLRKKRNINFSELDSNNEEDGRTFEENIADAELLPHELFEKKELATIAQNALDQISPESREIVLLHLAEGLTFEEISKLSKQPMNTVKSRYRRALISLKKLLEGANAPK